MTDDCGEQIRQLDREPFLDSPVIHLVRDKGLPNERRQPPAQALGEGRVATVHLGSNVGDGAVSGDVEIPAAVGLLDRLALAGRQRRALGGFARTLQLPEYQGNVIIGNRLIERGEILMGRKAEPELLLIGGALGFEQSGVRLDHGLDEPVEIRLPAHVEQLLVIRRRERPHARDLRMVVQGGGDSRLITVHHPD